LYYHIAIFSGKSPTTIKSAKDIGVYLEMGDPELYLDKFIYLPDFPNLFKNAIELMKKYNLLPNDSIILSTCKFHGIKYIASLDSDFKNACDGEGIILIANKSEFERITIV